MNVKTFIRTYVSPYFGSDEKPLAAEVPPVSDGPATVVVTEQRRKLPPAKHLIFILAALILVVMSVGKMLDSSTETVRPSTVVRPVAPGHKAAQPDKYDLDGDERNGSVTGRGVKAVPTKYDYDRLNRAEQEEEERKARERITSSGGGTSAQSPQQMAAEEKRKREEESLWASSVIQVHTDEPVGLAGSSSSSSSKPASVPSPSATPTMAEALENPPIDQETGKLNASILASRKDCLDTTLPQGIFYALCEGSIIRAVLDNRIVGEFAGPAKAYILDDIWSRDKSHVIIPCGTVAVGEASPVDKADQRRIKVAFHRLLTPDGKGVGLEPTIALDQAGETALSGKVNRHILSTFGTAALIGALAGFTQAGAGSPYTGNGVDAYRSGVSNSLSQQGQQVLQRGQNRLPGITIPEGKVVEIYISQDLHLPASKSCRA